MIVNGFDGGMYAPMPRAMTDAEARVVAQFLGDHPGFTVEWRGDRERVNVIVSRVNHVAVALHGWKSAAELDWGLHEAAKLIEAMPIAKQIGVVFTQTVVK